MKSQEVAKHQYLALAETNLAYLKHKSNVWQVIDLRKVEKTEVKHTVCVLKGDSDHLFKMIQEYARKFVFSP